MGRVRSVVHVGPVAHEQVRVMIEQFAGRQVHDAVPDVEQEGLGIELLRLRKYAVDTSRQLRDGPDARG